jgi:hypothetical protein
LLIGWPVIKNGVNLFFYVLDPRGFCFKVAMLYAYSRLGFHGVSELISCKL